MCVCLMAWSMLCAPLNGATTDEFRGIWVSRFEWPDRDPTACKAKIDEITKTVAAHGFNAVIFQMRGQCDTLYPSPEEPWSPLISADGADPGWDPMQYAIEAARAAGIEFHAYINTHVAWQAGNKQPPAAANHVFHQHFNAAAPATCDWLVHNGDGQPMQYSGDDYVWIAPGVPAAQAYTRRQIMHVVNRYDVDGIHFDRIRTPTADCSHDPISVARQATGGEGNPAGLDFDAWTNDQFTRFLVDLYAQVAQVKPKMKVSSAPLGLVSRDRYPEYPPSFHYGVTKCHQDAQAWLAAGAMDFVVPQIYWADDDNRAPDFSRILPDWLAHAAGRHVYPGQTVGVGVAQLIHQVQVTREQGGLGNVVFSYGGLLRKNGIAQYSKPGGIYASPAAIPAMPWKREPVDGIILGTITDGETNQPVTDAQIRRSDADYVALSSADGVFAFLKVPPGRYTLTVRKQGKPEQQVADVVVAAGQVVRSDVKLGEVPAVVAAAESSVAAASEPAGESALVEVAVEPGDDASTAVARAPSAPVSVTTVTEKPASFGAFRWVMIGVMVVGFGTLGVAMAWHFLGRRASSR